MRSALFLKEQYIQLRLLIFESDQSFNYYAKEITPSAIFSDFELCFYSIQALSGHSNGK